MGSSPTTRTTILFIPVPSKAGDLLRAIEGYEGQGLTKLALQLAPHVFVRPGEPRRARWEEFDFDEAVWTIPAEKTKMRKPHSVPLSLQSLSILKLLHTATGPEGYTFPSIRTHTRPMSENTINAALRRLASTLLNESGKWNPDAIERALAHGESNKVRKACHRGEHWDERVQMAQ